MRRYSTLAAVTVALLAIPQPAAADITAFLGITPTPENRAVRGVALGFGLLVIGFEFEYSSAVEDATEGLPSLQTGSGNLLVQTPIEISGIQFYGTVGGGAKIRLAGPLRLRLDYRIFRLQGSPLHTTYHRFYAGANLGF